MKNILQSNKIVAFFCLVTGLATAQIPAGYEPAPSTSALSTNGNFANMGGSATISGVVNAPATTAGQYNAAVGIYSQAKFNPNQIYEDNSNYNTYTIMSGSKSLNWPFTGALLNTFPGDPAKNVAPATNYLYSNGNVFPNLEYVIWGQTLTNLVVGRYYVFSMYVNNAIEPPAGAPDDPVVRLKVGGNVALPNGTTVAGPTTLTEAATASTQPLGGWKRVQHVFQATNTTQVFKVTSAASGTYGDDFQMTQVQVIEFIPILNVSSNSPVCLGGALNLTASTPATGTMTYSWTGPNGFTSSLQNPTRTNLTAADFGTYICTITDASGTTNTKTVSVSQATTGCPITTDLSITKTDGKTKFTPGTTTTYTVVVKNNGATTVTGANVKDDVPAGLIASEMSYSAVASAGSTTSVVGTKTGAINDLVTLAPGGTVTYTIDVFINPFFLQSQVNNLVNTATVTVPAGVTDTNLANNTATDTNTPGIDALNDSFANTAINNTVGGAAGNVLNNDFLNGYAITNPSLINITVVNNGGLSGVTIDANGNLIVPNGATPGAYMVQYQICEKADPTNCDTATAIVQVYLDSDGDGISDIIDLDDDNDGILDTVEEAGCTGTQVIFKEDFGTGARGTTPYTNYIYEPNSYSASVPGSNLDDGEYALVNVIDSSVAWWATCYWVNKTDHTGNPGGRMALYNASYTPGEFYRRGGITVPQNTIVNLSFWALNVDKADNCDHLNNRRLPKIRALILDASGNILASVSTGEIPKNENWNNYLYSFNTGSNTQVQIVLVNDAEGGFGNDIAIDDIQLALPCDSDGDGIPNILDLDSDNDGCADAIEGGDHVTQAMLNASNAIGTNSSGTLNIPPIATVDANGVPMLVNSGGLADIGGDVGQGIGDSQNIMVNSCAVPFICDTNMYIVQGNPSVLYRIDTSTNPFNFVQIGTGATYPVNATGYNPTDNFIYGINGGANVAKSLIRIDANGTFYNLGVISGLDIAMSYTSGEMDELGNYYIKLAGPNNNKLYKVDVATRTATLIQLSRNISFIDIAYTQTDGLLWAQDTVSKKLVSINPTNGLVTDLPFVNTLNNYGAWFGSSTGQIYASSNDGTAFVEFNKTTGEAMFISITQPSTNNDGAHCPTAPIKFDLYCSKLPVTNAGTQLPSNHGITALGRAGADNSNWPMVRQSAWTVLEAKTKGFVVNRVANPATDIANPVEGMMVFDTTAQCLKIYNGTVWSCYSTPACP